ncbi:unnamed protein product [Closterium sp. NIES-53]
MASLRVLAFDHEGRPVQFDMWLDDLQLYLLSDSKDIEDLVSHLRASDVRYRADVPAEFLDRNPPPMNITLYFIVTRLPESLRSVRDHFLSLDPTSLTVDLLEQHLLTAETSAVAVGAAHGTPRPPFFEGCSPSPLAPSYACAAAADVSVPENGGAASASAKRRSSKGKGGRGGGGDSGGGGGGSGSGGGGSSGDGGGGAIVGGSGGSGGGGGGSGGSGSSGGSRTGSVGLALGDCPYVIRTGDRAGQTCGRLHTQHRCFSHLDDAWRAEFGVDVELPRWADLLKSRIAIFDLDFDAFLSAMYALSVSAVGDCYRCEPPDPELQQRGQLRLAYAATRANSADVFTKALPPACFAFLDWSCDHLFSPTLPMGDLFYMGPPNPPCAVATHSAAGAKSAAVSGAYAEPVELPPVAFQSPASSRRSGRRSQQTFWRALHVASPFARGPIARGLVAQGVVARGSVSRGHVAQGPVARGLVAPCLFARGPVDRQQRLQSSALLQPRLHPRPRLTHASLYASATGRGVGGGGRWGDVVGVADSGWTWLGWQAVRGTWRERRCTASRRSSSFLSPSCSYSSGGFCPAPRAPCSPAPASPDRAPRPFFPSLPSPYYVCSSLGGGGGGVRGRLHQRHHPASSVSRPHLLLWGGGRPSSSGTMVLSNDIDLLHPPAELEKRKHKMKRLVPTPNSFFMDVKCQGCFSITTVFSHSQTVVLGLLLPQEGRLNDGWRNYSF